MSTSTAKKTARKATRKPTAMEAQKARQAELEQRAQEAFDARVEEAQADLDALERTVTQREWLIIRQRLDSSREQIAKEGGLRLLALAWIREKREHGGANWERLLELTDDELVALHGFPTESPEEQAAREAQESQDGTQGADQPDPEE